MDPSPFSIRELAEMAHGRRSGDWERTAWLTAAVCNGYFGRQSPVRPADVNPYAGGKRVETVTDDLGAVFDGMF